MEEKHIVEALNNGSLENVLEILDDFCPRHCGLVDRCDVFGESSDGCLKCWLKAVEEYKIEKAKSEYDKAMELVLCGATCKSKSNCVGCPYDSTQACIEISSDKLSMAIEFIEKETKGKVE